MSGVLASCVAASSGGVPYTLNITSGVTSPNLRALAVAGGWDGAGKLTVNITASYVAALSVPSAASAPFPGGLLIKIGSGSTIGATSSLPALTVAQAISIDNGGVIAGCGGNGGDGGWAQLGPADGGNRAWGGAGGTGQYLSSSTPPSLVGPTSGSPGQTVYGTGSPPYSATGGTGGTGGSLGYSGDGGGFGSTNSPGGSVQPTLNQGYGPGPAISGNSYITWVTAGTVRGSVS